MHETGCSGLVHWDGPEGWDGEGGGRGDSGWGTHVHPRRIHAKYGKNHCSKKEAPRVVTGVNKTVVI